MEQAVLMSAWQVEAVPQLAVPELDAQRHLVVLSRRGERSDARAD